MKGTEEEVLLKDDLDIEKGFNDAIDGLRKSLGQKGEEESEEELLEKAGKLAPPFKKKGAKASDEEPEEDEDEEDEEEEETRKSIEDTLREEPEAAAAMDVEPFLLQLAKALDEGRTGDYAVSKQLTELKKLVKSIGAATLATAELQKSTREIVKQIGNTSLPSGSVKQLRKARFTAEDGNPQDFDTHEVLAKSRDWLKTGKINLVEAGYIEGRINKGLLGKVNDRTDQKVAALMREEVA